MFVGVNIKLLINDLYASYEALPDEAKLIIYIILILIFIATILLIIMLEQRRLNKKIVNKRVKVEDTTEILDLDINDIDETNEKTRNLKEITDKIQAALDNENIDLTKYEQDQEETSIISYAELMKSVGKKVDTPEKDFSLPDLVHKIEVDEEIEKSEPYIKPVEKPVDDTKFKTSVFISPIFGIQEPNKNNIKEQPVINEVKEPTYRSDNLKDEEAFLNNLINFRKNLD
ncbi:MAG: hypothetical protein PHW90_03425 [Bacilli bacterium]|nr:hypothetical protein [Bacilli bacterium]